MLLLDRSQIDGLHHLRSGKVREVYDLGNELLIVATDRISAFDVVMPNGVPDKGRVLNQMSAFWFARLQDHCPHHVVGVSDNDLEERAPGLVPVLSGRTTIAKKADPIPIECVARGYLAGSLYKEYRASGGSVLGLRLPDGLVDGSMLPEPLFTPATKAQSGHDENISFERAADIVGVDVASFLRDTTLALYRSAAAHAAACGLILADTKFEFGWCEGEIVWIDEALTPDSSRYWDASLFRPGGPQPSFDKQFLRDYLESIGWDKRPPAPQLPEDVVERTRAKYLEAFARITGRGLDPE